LVIRLTNAGTGTSFSLRSKQARAAGVSCTMDKSTKSSIFTLLKANFVVGLPLYFCCILWLQFNVVTSDDIWLFLVLSFVVSFISFIIGLTVFLPFFTVAKKRGFASYPSIVLFCMVPSFCFYIYEPKLFYLYSMAISVLIGVVFIKLIGNKNECS